MWIHNLSLRFKFISGLVVFVLLLGIMISLIMYFHFNSIMQSEISQRARMLLAQSNAIQEYVKASLRPEMFDVLPEGRFVLKAMSSSYISRDVMARLNISDTYAYHYRRVSKKPRNPDSAPDAFEMELIGLFADNPELSIFEDTATVKGEKYHMVARPVVFGESCMQCHGDPQDAPGEMIEIYGSKNGFQYTVGEVGGVVVAGFPVNMIKGPVQDLTLKYLSLYLLGIFFFASLISMFFDRLVMKNLKTLGDIFKTRFTDDRESKIINKLGEKDEIEGVIEGVDELALCLAEARADLEDYTQNLEEMVEDRTLALKEKAEKHLFDVNLFVSLLAGFNQAATSHEFISRVLKSVGERFKASQVVYYCTVVSENRYALHEDAPVPELDPQVKDLLWKDDILAEDKRLYIPVKSSESHWGILSISWQRSLAKKDIDRAVMLGLGHQIAMVIENIQAFSDIRFQNDMLQSIFEGISDPLLLIDTQCHIIIANHASQQILRNDKRRLQRHALERFLSLKSRVQQAESLKDQLQNIKGPLSREIVTGDNRWFRVDLYPLPSRDQAVSRVVLYARDITMEAQMMKQMQQTERLSAIGKMAAGIAHEVNNPLGVIQCYTDLVRDAVSDDQVHQDIDVIAKHTRGVQKVVKDLLNLSRPKQVISGRCNINHVVSAMAEVFNTQGISKDIRITLDLEPDLAEIECDAAILEQILTNLCLNAFDAMTDQGGKVDISTRESGVVQEEADMVRLSVQDNGPGIDQDILPHIFDPFYTTKEVGKGTGLGLSVVYGFVNELGGHIEVVSSHEPQNHTRFDIYFPTVVRKAKRGV